LVQTAAFGPVLGPADELGIADPLLGFGDGAATYAAHHQFMPELVLIGQLVGFPMPLTSPITRSSSTVRLPSRAPRSGSASPVMSPGVKIGLPSASQMLDAIRPASTSVLPPMAIRSDLAAR